MPRTTSSPTTRAAKPKASARKPPARTPRPRRQRRNEGFARDVVSVVLITVGILSLAALVVPSGTGMVGQAIAAALYAFAGRLAICVPLALVVVGGLLVVDPQKVSFDEVALGVVLLLVSALSLVQVLGVEKGHDGDVLLRAAHGGWVGAMVGGTLRGYTGNVGACILLVALAVFAFLLVIDRPLPELVQHAGQGASRGAAALRGARGLRDPDAAPRKSPFFETDAPAEEPAAKGRKGRGKPAEEAPAPAAVAVPEPQPEPEPEPEPEPVIQPVLWNASSAKADAPEPVAEPPAPEKPARKGKKQAEKAAVDDAAEEESAEGAEAPPEAEPAPAREFILPPTTLLQVAQVLPEGPGAVTDTARNIKILEETLAQFKIEAKVVEIAQGPTFTRYEIRLAPGIRVSRIESLGDNIAMNLAALDVRIQAPIPGKAAIGIEVPNTSMAMVPLRDVVDSPEFQGGGSPLTFALGKDVTGRSWVADLTRMPHLLIGGATNSGKSVCLNCLIASILFRSKPEDVKFLLVDPKRVELSLFDGIPHLLYPVITDIKKAAGMLNWAIQEMERRYDILNKNGCRDIRSYNQRAQEEGLEHFPYIVIVVDELADLMMQIAGEVEPAICRLAQLARAIGIHLVIATQRPSVDVITGLIKANIPSRIAFAVSSHIDSRTILDKRGAERLLGRGDMLYDPIGASKPVRIQCSFISEREVETLVEYLRRQATPVYTAEPVAAPNANGSGGGTSEADSAEDDLFEDAVRLVVTTRRASTSSLQRKFSIGYTRAARLIDMMEERGIVSALDGAKPREVLASREQIEQFFRSPLNAPPEDGEGDESPFV